MLSPIAKSEVLRLSKSHNLKPGENIFLYRGEDTVTTFHVSVHERMLSVLFLLLTFLCWVLPRRCDPQAVQGAKGYPVALWNGKGQRGTPKQSRTCHSFLGGKPLGENPAGRQLPAVHLLRHLPVGLLRLTQGEPWTRSSLCVFSALLFFFFNNRKQNDNKACVCLP